MSTAIVDWVSFTGYLWRTIHVVMSRMSTAIVDWVSFTAYLWRTIHGLNVLMSNMSVPYTGSLLYYAHLEQMQACRSTFQGMSLVDTCLIKYRPTPWIMQGLCYWVYYVTLICKNGLCTYSGLFFFVLCVNQLNKLNHRKKKVHWFCNESQDHTHVLQWPRPWGTTSWCSLSTDWVPNLASVPSIVTPLCRCQVSVLVFHTSRIYKFVKGKERSVTVPVQMKLLYQFG